MATINAVIVDPDGTARKTQIEGTLGAFQAVVGGYIEGIFRQDFTIYVNEDGIMMRLPKNERVTEFLHYPYPLFGTALIVGPADDEGTDTDVPEHIIRYYELEQ